MSDGINGILRTKGNKNILKINKLKQSIFLIKIILLLFYISITEGKSRNIINFSQEIKLLIKGSGNQNLLYTSFYLQPSKVFVNNINMDSCKMSCELENEENNIRLIFDDNINSTKSMFYGSDNLIEINLSLFDFSHVTSMAFMFASCCGLTKINLGNINTSSVVNMCSLFSNCKQLISVDVSNLDTTQVTNMEGMFFNCTSLTSANISSFNTSKVENLRIFL